MIPKSGNRFSDKIMPKLTAIPKQNRRPDGGAGLSVSVAARPAYEVAPRTVTARRFCDQHEMSLQTATGRSLP